MTCSRSHKHGLVESGLGLGCLALKPMHITATQHCFPGTNLKELKQRRIFIMKALGWLEEPKRRSWASGATVVWHFKATNALVCVIHSTFPQALHVPENVASIRLQVITVELQTDLALSSRIQKCLGVVTFGWGKSQKSMVIPTVAMCVGQRKRGRAVPRRKAVNSPRKRMLGRSSNECALE